MLTDRGRSIEEGLATGRRLMTAQQHRKAVQIHRILALRFPRDARVYAALGQSLRGYGDHTKMTRAFRRAILLQPDAIASYFNFGNGDLWFDRPAPAIKAYRRAFHLDPTQPEILTALALAMLRAGEWDAAWPLYENRESCRAFAEKAADLDRTVWDGRLVRGQRILLVGEQGAGDVIQFIRYARFLHDAGMIVLVHCLASLERLFTAVPWIESASSTPPTDFDTTCLIMSLPHRFDAHPDNIPQMVPYLAAPGAVKASAPAKSPAVGLVWAGTPNNTRDKWRSCPLTALEPLLDVPGIRLQSLQFGWRHGHNPGPWVQLAPLDDSVADYADTAEVISGLDLIISVDTSVAHLAGAMGKPVWLLLGRRSDWRWLMDRDDTPWYPTLRLFRMNEADGEGDDAASWTNVVNQVEEALRKFAASE